MAVGQEFDPWGCPILSLMMSQSKWAVSTQSCSSFWNGHNIPEPICRWKLWKRLVSCLRKQDRLTWASATAEDVDQYTSTAWGSCMAVSRRGIVSHSSTRRITPLSLEPLPTDWLAAQDKGTFPPLLRRSRFGLHTLRWKLETLGTIKRHHLGLHSTASLSNTSQWKLLGLAAVRLENLAAWFWGAFLTFSFTFQMSNETVSKGRCCCSTTMVLRCSWGTLSQWQA